VLAELGVLRAAALASLCLGTVLSAMVYPFFIVATVLALADGALLAPEGLGAVAVTSLALSLFALGLFAMFAPALVGAVRRRQWRLLWALPALPGYVLLVSLAAWRGLLDWIFAPHHWHKTEHGFGRTSLRGAFSAGRATPAPLPAAVGRG
jgi:hypothetical protein